MGKSDFPSYDASLETSELAWEFQQERPDTCRIKWLVNEMGADVSAAIEEAHMDPAMLLKNPLLKPLKLYEHIHQ